MSTTPWFNINDPREILARNDEFRAIPSDKRSNPFEGLLTVDNWRPGVYKLQVPTLYPRKVFPRPAAISQERYNLEFNEKYPELTEILTLNDVYVAGGAASSIITGNNCGNSDIDIFITAGNVPNMKRLWRIADIICEKLSVFYDRICTERMNPGLITFKGFGEGSPTVQIILRAFPDLSGLLHGFDIPSCSIAFDGKTTYMTELCAWSHMNMVNIVYPKYRSTTYERRLIKYFNRGFALAMPNFVAADGSAGSGDAGITVTMPHLTIENLQCDKYFMIGDPKLTDENNVPVSDYEDLTISSDVSFRRDARFDAEDFDEELCQQKNNYLHQFGKPNPRFVYCSYKNTETGGLSDRKSFVDFGDDGPRLSDLINRDDLLRTMKWYAKIIYVVNGKSVHLRLDLQDTLMLTDEEKIYFQKKILSINKYGYGKFVRSKEIDEFLEGKVQEVMKKFDSMPETIDWWIMIDPSRQYTVSLNPIIEDARDWYGDYYREFAEPASSLDLLDSIMAYLKYVSEKSDAEQSKIFNTECPICTTHISKNELNVITLQCGHTYHWAAISDDGCQGFYKWINGSHFECMICRKNFNEYPAAAE
jgi:hypothetical protein